MINYTYQIKHTSFYPVLFLELFFPKKVRMLVLNILNYILLVFGVFFFSLSFYGYERLADKSAGVFLIILSIQLVIFALQSFFNAHYTEKEAEMIAGDIVYSVKRDGDLVKSFLRSDFGEMVMFRSEINEDSIKDFLSKRKATNNAGGNLPPTPSGKEFPDAKVLCLFLMESDSDFSAFLSGFGIDKNTFSHILDWVILDFIKDHRRTLWWSKEYLSKAQGFGKDWSFGHLFYLIKYGRDLFLEAQLPAEFDIKQFKNEVRQMESILLKGIESNVILIGEPGAGVSDAVLEFVRKLKRGKVPPDLEYKKVYSLIWNNIIATNKDKVGFESVFISILDEVSAVGNIILYIEDLPGFIMSAKSIGSNISSLLGPYLASNLQIIASSDMDKFHKFIENDSELMRRFDKIQILETDEEKTIEIIENTVRKLESKKGIYFSYPAIFEIVRGAGQYFPGSIMPNGAIDLLFEVLGFLKTGDIYASKSDVLAFIEMKTKIPMGDLGVAEKDKLLHLENLLHDRIVGQEEAISVISNAMRRARANIRNVKKPIGTFLFLGPTGVGKTETAKALSQVFFGDEKYMLRLDMTEYQDAGSLSRLIGSFESDKPGILSSMLRESPYGVLLLDEFEKAEKDVLNLFLQILDEGFFSDMNGKKVSLRNVIIIATSNAASDYLFELFKSGKKVSEHKDEIIERIVGQGIFKPELINRFDATVIYHPLNQKELTKIAELMLKKLKKRLEEKGMEFVITESLSSAVAKLGANEIFGARPMTRFIQDKIEEPIARKIIGGELVSGNKIEIKSEELSV